MIVLKISNQTIRMYALEFYIGLLLWEEMT